MKIKSLGLAAMLSSVVFAAPDPNFHIYLAFGQSNMEGQGNIEQQDKSVDKRFQMMATVDNCSGRKLGTWNDAVPPLASCDGKLGPTDYFGRTMVEKTDEKIKVGVIVVAVAGCDIGLFSKDNYRNYTGGQSWYTNRVNAYGGNPYGRLIEMAQKAQQDGVIKGIIFHQGETNAGDGNWPSNVKKVYDNIIKDLGLGDDVPFLAGEVLRSGSSAGANNNIAKLPQQSKNFYVISSEGFNQALGDGQNVHFTSQEYRDFGKRYAEKMIEVLGDKIKPVESTPAVASSASVLPTSSSTVSSSASVKPTSSSTVIPKSSTSAIPGSSSGFNWNNPGWSSGSWGDIHGGNKNDSSLAIVQVNNLPKSESFTVFDMQGRLLGSVTLSGDASVSNLLKARFHKPGIYLVKNKSFMKQIVVK